ncbi:hypothetical protein HY214_02440 [Candidatus Roizmanbacteria bacterium]|nr:hypothetical protein [Candidatus Roizmanbacteria bacterium]
MSAEGCKTRVLDLGIGFGGNYINGDPSSTLRIGVDINPERLISCQQTYGTPPVVANAFIDGGIRSLPVGNESVNKVEILFPYDSLLLALATQQGFWLELHRVLKRTGSVHLLLEDIDPPQSLLERLLSPDRLYGGPKKASLLAKNAGFSVKQRTLKLRQIEGYGTDFSQYLVTGLTKLDESLISIHEISAVKR